MRKLLLVKPYRPEKLFVTTPPLGLISVAAYVREKAQERGDDLDIKIVDLNPGRQMPADVMPELIAYEPDLIGISCLSCEADAATAMSHALKQAMPDVPIVLGGPYPSHDKEVALEDPCIDYLVINEGEVTFDDLITTLNKGGDPAQVAGIAMRVNGKPFFTPPRDFIQDLDSLPIPAYDLIDLPAYFKTPRHSRLIAHPEYTTVVSTRGCPYGCTYCHVTMGKKTRFRSAEKVVEELEHLVKNYGVREIQWADDIWNLRKDRSKKICDLILEKGLKIKMAWPNGVRGDIIDQELIDKMSAAGAYMITFAPESGSPRVQKYIQKNAKLDKLQNVITMAAKKGIFCHGFFMVGFPTETEEEMQMTFDYALESKLNTASFFIVNANPGTKLYEQAKALGLKVDYEPGAHNYMDPDFQLSEVSTERMRKMMRRAYLRFFTDPRRMARLLWTMPHKGQLFGFAKDLVFRLYRNFRFQRPDIYQAEGIPRFERQQELQAEMPINRA
ncbi:MAG: B12-binding domain-containing radical SAM protein [Planctomycetota bacterium]|jgi:radical SAM superfamily enzyme YgiQ (UPF0313 family)